MKTVSSISELIATFRPCRKDKRWFYRGQADAAWPVTPKAGRPEYKRVKDVWLFESWMKRSLAHTDEKAKDEWDWLSIAQHHGLATRLLDWTANPLVAAYFAALELPEKDGAIIAVHFRSIAAVPTAKPFATKEVALYRPRGVVPRIVRQGGCFTCHPEPSKEIAIDGSCVTQLEKILVQKDAKKELLAELSYFGVNSYTLFPDLDGLSEYINWTATSGEYYK